VDVGMSCDIRSKSIGSGVEVLALNRKENKKIVF